MTSSNFSDPTEYQLEKYYKDNALPIDVLPSDDASTLILPDLHGNVMGALFRLEKEGVLKIKDTDRQKLSEIYQKRIPSVAEVKEFIEILKRSESGKNKFQCVRFIGDILGDRGKNDIFMLYLLEHLKNRNDIKTEVILSNHDLHYISWMLFNCDINKKREAVGFMANNAERSLENLDLYWFDNPEEREEIQRLFKEVYTPMVKLVHASVQDPFEEKPKLLLHYHAPVGIEAIRSLAKFFFNDFEFKDSPLEVLLETIDAINTEFQILMRNKDRFIAQLLKEEEWLQNHRGPEDKKIPNPTDTPIIYLVSNRDVMFVEGPRDKSYKLHIRHGHAGRGLPLYWNIPNTEIQGINIDNTNWLGHATNDEKNNPLGRSGSLNCYQSKDTGAALVYLDEKSVSDEDIAKLKTFEYVIVLTEPSQHIVEVLRAKGIKNIKTPADIKIFPSDQASDGVFLSHYLKKLHISSSYFGAPTKEDIMRMYADTLPRLKLNPVVLNHIQSLINGIHSETLNHHDLSSMCILLNDFNNYLNRFETNVDLNVIVDLTKKIYCLNQDISISDDFANLAIDAFINSESSQLKNAYSFIQGCRVNCRPEVTLLSELHNNLKCANLIKAQSLVSENVKLIKELRKNPNTKAKKLLLKLVENIEEAAPKPGILNTVKKNMLIVKERTLISWNGLSNFFMTLGVFMGVPAGMYWGGLLGATIGTVLFPGFGTIIGGVVGALSGALAGVVGGTVTAAVFSVFTGLVNSVWKSKEIKSRKNKLVCQKIYEEFNFDNPIIRAIRLPYIAKPANSNNEVASEAALIPAQLEGGIDPAFTIEKPKPPAQTL